MNLSRDVFSTIWEKIDSHEIILLNGPRQAGKTTLLKMLKAKLIAERNIQEKQIFWYDLEKADDLFAWSEQKNIFSVLPLSDKTTRFYVFIDEFQKSKTIGSTLKVIHDHYPNFKVIITGSASWYLDINESLAGRKRVIPVWPLSFSEYINWHEEDNFISYYKSTVKNIANAVPEIIESINQRLLNFLAYGGYPAVILNPNMKEKQEIISEILNSFVIRDLQIWQHAVSTLEVKTVLSLLASQTSSLLNASHVSSNTGLGRTALLRRLDLMQNTFIIELIRPYFTNKIKELTKAPKLYLIDTGLRNALLNNFSLIPGTTDFGLLAENFVFSQLRKTGETTDQLFYWRTPQNQEVDLVLKLQNELVPVEVKSGNESGLPTGLKAFIDRYNPKTAYVLNWSIVKESRYKNTSIFFRPLWFPIL